MRISNHPLRSVLYVPADKPRAIEKSLTLRADAIIFDLEDAVAPDNKAMAREALRDHFKSVPEAKPLRVIRINGLETEWGTEDFLAARACLPDAILLPKVNQAADLAQLHDALTETDAPNSMRIWAMIETAKGVANAVAIAHHAEQPGSRLDCFVTGTNDLFKETGLSGPETRPVAAPWLMQIVLAARAHGLAVLDGVFNNHTDNEGFAAHCADGAARGFDGVTVIHPSQIEPANMAYAPSEQAIAEAKAIVDAFDLPKNKSKGVIAVNGKMVERLHLEQAMALLAKAELIHLTAQVKSS